MSNYKELEYQGTKILVSKNGDIIWNGKNRNIYYNSDGYSTCAIKIPNKGWRSVRVARLVALAHIPNPNNLPEVNHKDYNRKNSNVDNLEWMSRLDNIHYSLCNRPDYNGSKNPNYGNRKLSNKYKNDKAYALEKQSRPKLQNGRCRKIHMYKGNILIKSFDYIAECCKFLIDNKISKAKTIDSVRSQIDKSIRESKQYAGYTFIKE